MADELSARGRRVTGRRLPVLHSNEPTTASDQIKLMENELRKNGVSLYTVCKFAYDISKSVAKEEYGVFLQVLGVPPVNTSRVISHCDLRPETPPQTLQPETPSSTYKFGPQSERAGVGSTTSEQDLCSMVLEAVKIVKHQKLLQAARDITAGNSPKVMKRRGRQRGHNQPTRTPTKPRSGGSYGHCGNCGETGHNIRTCQYTVSVG
ncbi:hypothetical protein COCC4DRAFT_173652 [Bipolaris maydis ATCC 48331]|uniref:CCHC-type domain-containing protein n=2 Tax=Cochliobolus heterostrophus TaxID=5016 RepID=M2UFW9_COCH5|nr:uncharacterized protein COCC4DRAFT_173652 [Bipolaris maydis ATCC 48331]EMD86822.1 hypothetical protein COCHEDRAFT_1198092 [Bipolaris maydis C5]KAJ6192159.1 hypothetical protein J3E72DRAFT_364401 [Bipolaris maydis]ENI03210.1 hypothetical protein COCC4DRAFT_173652 [Bipolaris maydis ATCC 48331]KAJ6203615.1 hypothetical protein PSV09DRAFT_1198092 [Bipolaris maydis]KAJ6267281.1 hypothetical protein PSV08DRAFT_411754 [Bipolaris maydis]